ncbi:PREDICTED: complement C3-like [Odobenus rosmarus divergens]|uniref:Complement C3-like n=1 Tax=Odobenus rosmarus divergens TaxID=9708 RepID=A0A9B0GH96_ODORO
MVQAETSGVKIIRSPYSIKFIRTPQYFKPGMPFHVKVFVSNPDGSPASRVLVRCQDKRDCTSANGVAILTINTNAKNREKLPILVETDEPLRPEEQASANMTAWPYSTQGGSGNILHIEVKTVAELKVGLKKERTFQTLKPNSQVEVKVTGDEEATVGLVAVDKAVYVLNSKHKLTQKKVWDVVEEHDIGCTAGSGNDGLAVFKDAGLDLKMSTGMHTPASSDWQGPQSPPASRHRRSLKWLETKRNAGYTHMLTHRSAHGTYHISNGHLGSTWLTSYVFRVFALAYSIMTTSTFDLHSLCATANWIIAKRQAEDGHFLENGPVIMALMQGGYRGSEANIALTALVLIALDEGRYLCSREIPNLPASME